MRFYAHRLFMLSVVLLFGWYGTVRAQTPVTPIPPQVGSQKVDTFVGSKAVAKPITASSVPSHPFMAANGRSNVHNDAYMSDTYVGKGPLGVSPTVLSSTLGGVCVSVGFDQQGRLLTICLTLKVARFFLVDPVTLAPLASLDLPAKESSGTNQIAAGSYFYVDQRDHAIIPTADRTIWDVAITGRTLTKERVYDLSKTIAEDDTLASVLPDFSGNLWFVSKAGMVGYLKVSDGTASSLQLANEAIENSFALDETGGVYIASSHAMYRFDIDSNGKPAITWRESYERGSGQKPGQFSYGTGTTPTLMGKDYVTIADNADQMHVLVYRRAAKTDGTRLVCSVAVFSAGQSATENSLIATEKSIIVENNYGYAGPSATLLGKTTQPGITRIDVDATGQCRVVWTSDEHVPNVVSKLSLATGLVYSYTKAQGPAITDAWYFTAIDFETGKTVFKVLAGTGLNYNSHYAGLYLGPDGTAYIGVIGGLVAVHDGT